MELKEKLKVVAEYDPRKIKGKIKKGSLYKDGIIWDGFIAGEAGNIHTTENLKYPTSFDWSVPVYSKCIKELHETIKPFTEAAGVLVALEQRAERAIQNNDKIAFFENLYNLITELQKAKQ